MIIEQVTIVNKISFRDRSSWDDLILDILWKKFINLEFCINFHRKKNLTILISSVPYINTQIPKNKQQIHAQNRQKNLTNIKATVLLHFSKIFH